MIRLFRRELPLFVLLAAFGVTTSGCQVSTEVHVTTDQNFDMTAINSMITGKSLSPAVIETTHIVLDDGEAGQLAISGPKGLDVESSVSSDGKVHISFSISAPNAEAIKAFKKQIRSNSGSIRLNTSGSYFCIHREMTDSKGNFAEFVAGTCIRDVKIQLPKKSRTDITYNGLTTRPLETLNPNDLAEQLCHMDSDMERAEVAERYAQKHPKINAENLAAILNAISSDMQKKEVVEKLQGGISDPGNLATVLGKFDGDMFRKDAVEALVRKADGRFISMSQVVTVLAKFDGDMFRSDAAKSLAGHVRDNQNIGLVLKSFDSDMFAGDALRALAE